MSTWNNWGDVFNYYYLDVKGHDHGSAAHMADEWQHRRKLNVLRTNGQEKQQAASV